MTTLVFDIETDGLLREERNAKTGELMLEMSRLWLLIVGDPATGEIAAYSDVDGGLPPVREGYERLLGADRIVGHNVLNFDIPALGRFGYLLDHTKAIDTMVLSRLREPSREGGHSLAVLGEALGKPKGEFSDFGRYSQEMLDYAIQDVDTNIAIWEDLKHLLEDCPDAVDVEHIFGWCMSLQMQNGFAFDMASAVSLLGTLEQEKDDLEHGLQDVFPPRWVKEEDRVSKRTVNYKDPTRGSEVAGCAWTKIKYEVFNPGSRKQIADRLIQKYGWKPRKYTGTGIPQVDEAVLSDLPFEEARALVTYFDAQKKLGQVTNWLKAEKDGRVHGYINTIGANTHRCTHNNPNVAQVDKDQRMRSCWKASDGMKLVGSDAEGLELRMLGHYLAKFDGGEFARAVIEGQKADETDVHSLNRKAAGFHDRDNAKTLIYALIYGAGNAKLGMIAIADAVEAGKPVPKGKPYAIGKALRARLMANIPGLGRLTNKAQKRAGVGYLTGLDGRRVHIRSAHSALNTLLQSAGAIVMKWAVRCFWEREAKAYENGVFRFCVNVHDEQQFEVLDDLNYPEEIGQSFSQAITEAGVRLGVRCPLSGAYDIGDNWSQTH